MWRSLVIVVLTWFGSLALAETQVAREYPQKLAQLQAQLKEDPPTNTAVLLQLGDLCHDKGVEDDHDAVKLAEKYLTRLLELDPTNALGRAIYGSTLTMKGRDSFWFTTKLSWVKAGIKEMDAAVNMATNSVRVRFVRANNNYYMPKFLDRQEIVEADFAWLWAQVKAHPDCLEGYICQIIALRQGQLLAKKKKWDEALPIWRQALAFDPKSEVVPELRAELEKHKN